MLCRFINKEYPFDIQQAFSTLEKILALKEDGILISRSSKSTVMQYEIHKKRFYIKHYFSKGKKLKKYFGRSRYRAEWSNLNFCEKLGIKIPKLVAYGEQKKWFGFKLEHGIIITEEVQNAENLKSIAFHHPHFLKNKQWRKRVIHILSSYLKKMHTNKFIHYDLQWRNILVTKCLEKPDVYLFDIPSGKLRTFGLRHGIKRDFYNLYKNAYHFLSRTDQLRFYLNYRNISSLTTKDKQHIRKILDYCYKKELYDP